MTENDSKMKGKLKSSFIKNSKKKRQNNYYLAQKYRHKRFRQYLSFEQKIDVKISEIQKLEWISDQMIPTALI